MQKLNLLWFRDLLRQLRPSVTWTFSGGAFWNQIRPVSRTIMGPRSCNRTESFWKRGRSGYKSFTWESCDTRERGGSGSSRPQVPWQLA